MTVWQSKGVACWYCVSHSACAPFPPPAVHYLPTRKAVMAVFLPPDGYIRRTPGSASGSFHTPHLRRHHSLSVCKCHIFCSHTRSYGIGHPDHLQCILRFPGKDMSSDYSLLDNPSPLFLQLQCRLLRLPPRSKPLRT